MLAYAPRPSEASLKIYERSESINLLLLLEFMQIFANNCPLTEQSEVKKNEQSEVKKNEQSEFIGQLSTEFFIFYF
jgi:hypothetical protein